MVFYYLLKAKEQAAAEKQPVIQVPRVPSAGNATQLRAAPIMWNIEFQYVKEVKKKKKDLGICPMNDVSEFLK